MKNKQKQVLYYNDELNDEVIKNNYKERSIEKYNYNRSGFLFKTGNFIVYRLLATPFAFCYSKLHCHVKYENREVLKKVKSGYIVFANHTHEMLDAFSPSIAVFPKRVYTIVNKENLFIPFIGKMIQNLNGIPLLDGLNNAKSMLLQMKNVLKKRNVIIIYPEAHIWPFYTKIRQFPETAIKYSIMFNVPSFAFTTTYQTKKNGKMKIVTYIDGPFYPNDSLNSTDKLKDLHQRIFECMNQRSQNSTYEKIIYKKGHKTND